MNRMTTTNTPMPVTPEWIRPVDAWSYFRLSRTKIYSLMDEGKLSNKKVGKARLIETESIRIYIASL